MKNLTPLEAAIELIATIKGKKHPYYARVNELSDKYMMLSTGENIGPLMIQFNPREDEIMFEQRKRITKTIVGAVTNKVRGPFEKVSRSNNVTKKFETDETETKVDVEKLISTLDHYWGDESLDDYMSTRMIDLSFTDPNAFIVTEKAIKPDGTAMTMPFEVLSKEALNYSYTNNSLDFLCIFTGKKYTLYAMDFFLMAMKVKDADKDDKSPDVKPETLMGMGQEPGVMMGKVGNAIYTFWMIPNDCGEIPAIRVGYKRDETTFGNTFVSPMHKGIPRLEKIIKADSELDLTLALHTFPQKFQLVDKCPGKPHEGLRCEGGYVHNGTNTTTCGVCKGVGWRIHKSAQDAIFYPMPTKDELERGIQPMDLDKLMVYKGPDINLIKFQDEYARNLEHMVVQDIYISQAFEKPNDVVTATQSAINIESVYDTLYPFARQFSTVFKKQVRITACVIGIQKGLKVIHYFPKDLKLKTREMLIAEYGAAEDASLPESFKKQIANDIAEKMWHDDPRALQKWQVKQQHALFTGKSPSEIQGIIAAGRTTKFNITLYTEFENIFQQLEDELWASSTPRYFYDLPYRERLTLIAAKVQQIETQKATDLGIADIGKSDDEEDPLTA